jgi:hypothetical protein
LVLPAIARLTLDTAGVLPHGFDGIPEDLIDRFGQGGVQLRIASFEIVSLVPARLLSTIMVRDDLAKTHSQGSVTMVRALVGGSPGTKFSGGNVS